MPADDPLRRREADAGPREFLGRMQALKRNKKRRGIRHVEAGAVVTDEVYPLAALQAPAELYACMLPPGRELPGISQQIVEQDAQQLLVARITRVPGEHDFHMTIRVPPAASRQPLRA